MTNVAFEVARDFSMPISVKCLCGKKLSLKDDLAGKKVKCPACQKVLSVPKPEVVEESPRVLEASDEDDFEDEREEAPAKSRRARKSAPSGAKSPKVIAKGQNSKSNQRGMLFGLASGGGVLVASVLTWMFWPAKPAENVAANPPGDAPAKVATPASDSRTAAIPTADKGSGVDSSATTSSATGSNVAADSHSGPRFPGGVAQPPEWLVGTAPFDVVKLFAAPAPDQNAAPLYLDAIFEFSADLASCFPPGPETDQRRRAALERGRRHQSIFEKNYSESSPEQIDAMLRDHEVGFQKLMLAQQRPQCVFQTGLGMELLLPHAQGFRQVVRVAAARTYRDLQSRNFERPLDDIERMLRVSRDLTARGLFIAQLVSMAAESHLNQTMVQQLLITPGVKTEHCDRLLAILRKHEADSREMVLEGTQMEYVLMRVLLRDLQSQSGSFSPEGRRAVQKSWNTKDDSVVTILLNMTDNDKPSAADVEAMQALIAKLDEPAEVTNLNDQFRAVLAIAAQPYQERSAAFLQLTTSQSQNKQRLFTKVFEPHYLQFLEGNTRTLTRRHATQALVALRRWQLMHSEAPRDLAPVMADAGINAVPIDPFAGAPLKLAMLNGQPVVYSIGPDGKDDGGKIEWKLAPGQPGDFLFPMQPSP